MILYILRGAFILLATAVTSLYLLSNQWGANVDFPQFVMLLGITVGITAVIIAVDTFTHHKKLSAISGVFLGLIAGLLVAYALSFVVDLIGADRVALGSDYPFPLGEHHPGELIESSDFSDEVKVQLLSGSALEWLSLTADRFKR